LSAELDFGYLASLSIGSHETRNQKTKKSFAQICSLSAELDLCEMAMRKMLDTPHPTYPMTCAVMIKTPENASANANANANAIEEYCTKSAAGEQTWVSAGSANFIEDGYEIRKTA
jgi:hypothetical protein